MSKVGLSGVITAIVATAMIYGATPSFAAGIFAGAPSAPSVFTLATPDQSSVQRKELTRQNDYQSFDQASQGHDHGW